jgi:hypothetical protein
VLPAPEGAGCRTTPCAFAVMLIAEVAIKYARGGVRVKTEVTHESLTSTVAVTPAARSPGIGGLPGPVTPDITAASSRLHLSGSSRSQRDHEAGS